MMDPITAGTTTGFAAKLTANFNELAASIAAAEDLIRTTVVRLHGEGSESGCGLAAGTGLWVEVGTGAEDLVFWIDGERHVVAAEELPLTVVIPESEDAVYIYMYWENDAPVLRVLEAKTVPSPDGRFYVGSASSDADSCTGVSTVDQETVNASALMLSIQSLSASVVALWDAIGAAYLSETPPDSSLDTRVSAIEAGVAEGGDPTRWGGLEEATGNPTTIRQALLAAIAAHVEALHGSTADGGEQISYVVQEFDAVSANVARGFLLTCRTLNPNLYDYLTDCFGIVWLVAGMDIAGPVDWTNSTWVVAS